jgi:hypothetical protein
LHAEPSRGEDVRERARDVGLGRVVGRGKHRAERFMRADRLRDAPEKLDQVVGLVESVREAGEAARGLA